MRIATASNVNGPNRKYLIFYEPTHAWDNAKIRRFFWILLCADENENDYYYLLFIWIICAVASHSRTFEYSYFTRAHTHAHVLIHRHCYRFKVNNIHRVWFRRYFVGSFFCEPILWRSPDRRQRVTEMRSNALGFGIGADIVAQKLDCERFICIPCANVSGNYANARLAFALHNSVIKIPSGMRFSPHILRHYWFEFDIDMLDLFRIGSCSFTLYFVCRMWSHSDLYLHHRMPLNYSNCIGKANLLA